MRSHHYGRLLKILFGGEADVLNFPVLLDAFELLKQPPLRLYDALVELCESEGDHGGVCVPVVARIVEAAAVMDPKAKASWVCYLRNMLPETLSAAGLHTNDFWSSAVLGLFWAANWYDDTGLKDSSFSEEFPSWLFRVVSAPFLSYNDRPWVGQLDTAIKAWARPPKELGIHGQRLAQIRNFYHDLRHCNFVTDEGMMGFQPAPLGQLILANINFATFSGISPVGQAYGIHKTFDALLQVSQSAANDAAKDK